MKKDPKKDLQDYHSFLVKSAFEKKELSSDYYFADVTLSTTAIKEIISKYFKIYRPLALVHEITFNTNFDDFKSATVLLKPLTPPDTEKKLESDMAIEQALQPSPESGPTFQATDFYAKMELQKNEIYSMASLYVLEKMPHVQIASIEPEWKKGNIILAVFKQLSLSGLKIKVYYKEPNSGDCTD